MKNYVIIGGGVASVACIEGIRSVDKEGKIYLICGEKRPTYCRPLISYYLEGRTDFEKMQYRPADFYEKNGCELVFATAEKIDEKNKTVTADGKNYKYDKLLVATGSSSFVPPFPGLSDVKNKFTFMTESDAESLNGVINENSRVLIIGAGLIGLKCAEGLAGRVKSITVCDLATRVLSSILDEDCAPYMQAVLEKNGISFMLGDSAAEFNGNTAHMKSGGELEFDVLVLALGVRANVSLVKDIGGTVNRGIVVNEFMETSIKDVYSAGDCAEGYDASIKGNRILALFPSAYAEGFTAGANMAGESRKLLNEFPLNSIGFFGLHVMTAGAYVGKMTEIKTESGIKRLFIDNDKLVGFIIIGDVKGVGIYTNMIREGTPVSSVNEEILINSPSLAIFSPEIRAKILGSVV